MGQTESLLVDKTQDNSYCQIDSDYACPAPKGVFTDQSSFEREYLKTNFFSKWTKRTTQKHPETREQMVQVYSNQNEMLYICFGEKLGTEQLSDFWSYNMKTNQWRMLNSKVATPRSRCSSVYGNDIIYVFGGLQNKKYLDELLAIDPQTGNAVSIQTTGDKPCPRANASIGFYDNKLYVWGGNDGYVVESSIHILDLSTKVWRSVPCNIPSRFNASCVCVERYIFIFGSDRNDGLLRMNMVDEKMYLLSVTGLHPPNKVTCPAMVRVGGYLFVFGGTCDTLYTLVYGFNILRNRWFIFHIRPDDETTTRDDGEMRVNQCFAVPRESGMAVGFQISTRSILYTLGSGMKQDAPVCGFDIGEALAVLNHGDDMLDMFMKTK